MKKEEVIDGLDALFGLIEETSQIAKDAVRFITEKNMWEEFMKFHVEQHIKKVKE